MSRTFKKAPTKPRGPRKPEKENKQKIKEEIQDELTDAIPAVHTPIKVREIQ